MKRPPPPLLALAAGLVQRAWAKDAPTASAPRRALAAGTAVASLGLAAGAERQFRAQHTTVEPFEPAKATSLVVTGPNRLTRNPMYVGLAGVLVANALRRGSWVGLLPVAAFVAVIDRFQVAAEERALAEKFGADYDAYRSAVPRWVGLRSLG
jgi:protein-S-isoprenylcysteine O-methyltransferase Ste14